MLLKILVVVSLLFTSGCSLLQQELMQPEPSKFDDLVAKVQQDYKQTGIKTTNETLWVVSTAYRELQKFGLENHLEVFIALMLQESEFHTDMVTGNSVGLCQINAAWAKVFLEYYSKSVGLIPGALLTDAETSIQLGVAAFAMHLGYARGETWDAVRRYNGSGSKARQHSRAVKRIYRRICVSCEFNA